MEKTKTKPSLEICPNIIPPSCNIITVIFNIVPPVSKASKERPGGSEDKVRWPVFILPNIPKSLLPNVWMRVGAWQNNYCTLLRIEEINKSCYIYFKYTNRLPWFLFYYSFGYRVYGKTIIYIYIYIYIYIRKKKGRLRIPVEATGLY